MEKHKINKDEIVVLLLLTAIIFGGLFRIMPALLSGFPLNDGGMFYTMILDLQANHFILPAYTTYNLSSIPYAYPPLGFYIGAGISSVLNISPLIVLRWLPGIINTLCIPGFYFFAKEVLPDKFQSAFATLVYAMIPHLTSWLSMGGGLTRSLGMLFMLLTLGFVHRVFSKNDTRSIFGAIIFGGLTVLSHTEAPIYTIAISIYIWAMKSRTIRGILHGLIIAIGVLVLTAPWSATIIRTHELAPFLSILQTGSHSVFAVVKILNIAILTEEPYLGVLGVIGILGIAVLVAKKDYFIPLMLPVVFISQPRSAHVIGNIPLALAGGVLVAEVILPGLENIQISAKKLTSFFIIIVIYLLSNSLYYSFLLSMRVISEQERAAMNWIGRNTPEESTFLVITGNQNAYCDPINEWFPSLTRRESLTTIQGSEWLLGGNFGKNAAQVQGLEACIDDGMECFTRESNLLTKSFDYVYISITPTTEDCGVSETSKRTSRALALALSLEPGYSTVYRTEGVILFQKSKN